MSARMVQRVLRDSKAAPIADVPVEDKDAEDEEEPVAQVVRNRFDLLCLQDEDEDVELHEDNSRPDSPVGSVPQPAPSKARKKKKGKKKGKVAPTAVQSPGEADADYLELEEICGVAGSATSSGSSQKKESRFSRKASQLLVVDPKFLKAEDELRRIFGSKVINSVERREEGGGSMGNWRRRPPNRRGPRAVKKCLLSTNLEQCPRGDVSMELLVEKNGLQYFRYKYSASYMETQRQFDICVRSHNPNRIVMLLAQHPYHVDSLLAMAELHRHMGQHQQAAQHLERCLFVLECAWHPLFDPTLGTCRLEWADPVNRPLFKALFKHMQHLGRRGCHRTAVEVCKLLLCLDPADPMGALFCIDYFALRAEQYEWLERFVDEYETDKSLALFPSFSLSLAVARFRLEEKAEQSREGAGRRLRDEAAGQEQQGRSSSASLLRQALMLHPYMLVKIVEKAPIKEDASWAKVTKHPFFSLASVDNPTLEHVIAIYLERSYLLWRAVEVQNWLKSTASDLVGSPAVKDGGEAATWACVRDTAFSAGENEYSHLHLSDFSDSAATLPPEEVQEMDMQVGHGLMGDNIDLGHHFVAQPLDPADIIEVAIPEEGHGILALLQSLLPLPWMDPWAEFPHDELDVDGSGSDDNNN